MLLPGVECESWEQGLLAGALLGAVYVAVRPALRLAGSPIGCLTLGAFNVGLDVGIIYFCVRVIDGFAVAGPGWALAMSAFVNLICGIVGGIKT